MDLLHSQLAALQQKLSFVATDPIDWKFYVQVFSWSVTLFESYLLSVLLLCWILFPNQPFSAHRLRQYPLYSKTSPPEVLVDHFDAEAFTKSQNYGKDKAKFSLITGLFKQALDSAMLHYGLYAFAWDMAGGLIAYFGYSSEYEVQWLPTVNSNLETDRI